MNATSGPNDVLETQLRFIYNGYRTALLNRKYYGFRLSLFQRYNTILEIVIAVGAAGSGGVAGLAIWGSIPGQYTWLVISGIATLLGILKPILQLGRHIENYTKLYAGHSNVYLDLKSIVEDIEVSRAIPAKTSNRYDSIRNRISELGGLNDPRPNNNLIFRLQGEVNEEIPPESLWFPSVPSKQAVVSS